ncbi:hypothetical protein P154DRAFT_523161 [Amniculicola lignicola CBS 123094]|uniref:Brl1/Brr6 domain-containing protein n=1 Tax=Amniculicola lignicola CBS 123094 TaxID=1392246 RepID=A0A6A5WCP5_9PLEO|nr:hypothetical protein P154DRAFT_523161 [Amniculicola lignicola CBS 123094]
MSGWARGSTTPMEFEYENKTGPIDSKSPFTTAFPSHAAKKRKLDRFGTAAGTAPGEQELISGPIFGQTGPHSVLDSPLKNGFSAQNRMQLREPNSQPYYFPQTQTNKPLPSTPSRVQDPKIWGLRTPTSTADFSSGGETPETPARNDDSEAATPDTQMSRKMGQLMDGDRMQPIKRRESFFRSLFSSSPSPTKEKSKEASSKLWSKKAENRVMKRRSKKSKQPLSPEYDSDNNGQLARSYDGPSDQQHVAARPATVGDVLSWVEAHPHLPGVMMYWVSFAVNSMIAGFFLYIVYWAWSAVMSDVDVEAQKTINEIMVEIAFCHKEWKANNCDPKMRVPALEDLCGNWEKCMSRDAQKVARARVTATTFAKIFNAFVEEFSYKSMIFTACIVFGGFNLSNWAFGVMRTKAESFQHAQPPLQRHDSNTYPSMPATPQRFPSGGFIEHGGQPGYFTPYGSVNQSMVQQAGHGMPMLLENGGMGDGEVKERERDRVGERRSPRKRETYR